MAYLPEGFHLESGSALADARIDEGIAENEAEVHAIFDANVSRHQRVRCAYCRTQITSTRAAALSWFGKHDCRVDELQARRNQAAVAINDAFADLEEAAA